MPKTSEGIRRVAHLIGALLAIGFLVYVLRDSGRVDDGWAEWALVLAILATGFSVFWLIGWGAVVGLYWVVAWVLEGFKADRGAPM